MKWESSWKRSFSEAAAAGASFQGPLLVECAALGGDTSLSLLLVQKTQDRRLRLLCAGFKSLAEYMNIDVEEREGGGSFQDIDANRPEATRPLKISFWQGALRSIFPCPPNLQSYFEVEVDRVGEWLSLGFASTAWYGWPMSLEGDDFSVGLTGSVWKDNSIVGLGIDRCSNKVYISVKVKDTLEARDSKENVKDRLETRESSLPNSLYTAELFPAIAAEIGSSIRVNWGGSSPFQLNSNNFPSVLHHARESHARNKVRYCSVAFETGIIFFVRVTHLFLSFTLGNNVKGE